MSLQEGRPRDRGAAAAVRPSLAGHDLPGAAGGALRVADCVQVPQHRARRHAGAPRRHRILLQERGGTCVRMRRNTYTYRLKSLNRHSSHIAM